MLFSKLDVLKISYQINQMILEAREKVSSRREHDKFEANDNFKATFKYTVITAVIRCGLLINK